MFKKGGVKMVMYDPSRQDAGLWRGAFDGTVRTRPEEAQPCEAWAQDDSIHSHRNKVLW